MSDYSKEVNRCLSGVKRGKAGCFEKLFELTANHLRYIALKHICDKSLVDDVVSETYVRVMKYIYSYDGNISGLAWLYKIVKNVCMDMNDKEKRERDIIAMETAAALDISENENMEDSIDLFTAMKDVDDVDKEILRMRFYEDMTLEDIGKEIGITKTVVCKRVKRILRGMSKHFK